MIYSFNKNKYGQTIDTLQFASLLYLAIPLLLFFVSWLKWYYALVMISFLIFPLFHFNYKGSFNGVKKFSCYFFVFSCFLILLGYGEIFPQSGDWGKHNAIFSQLYNNWNQPVFIYYKGVKHIVCYGLGFYMIPAWVAGIFKSYFMIKWLVLINSTIGLTLIGLWCNRIWNLPLWACVLVFLVGSLDWIRHLNWYLNNFENCWDIFFHIGNIQFLTVVDQTPQHEIAILLIFLTFFNQIKTKEFKYQYLFYLIIIGFFWSPFIGFALLPLVFFINIKRIKLSNYLVTMPCMFLIGTFLFYYYSLHLSVDKVTLEMFTIKLLVYELTAIYSILFGIPLAFIFLIDREKKIIKKQEVKLILSFLIISFFFRKVNYGFFNDFEGKTTFLIFFIFNIFIYKVLIPYFSTFNFISKIAIFFYLFVLSFMPIKILIMKTLAINSPKLRKNFYCNPYLLSSNNSITLNEVLQNVSQEKDYPFIVQYIGENNIVSEQLLKKNNFVK